MSLTIIQRGRQTLAGLIKRADLWLLVGTGASSWPVPQPPRVQDAAVGLVTPVALVRLVSSAYVQPTAGAPEFSTDDGQGWVYANARTPHLGLDFRLAPTDLTEVDVTTGLREVLLVADPVFVTPPAAGQRIVPIEAVASFGDPIAIEHTVPMYRTGVDEIRRYVVSP
jgi:hypothetical protein